MCRCFALRTDINNALADMRVVDLLEIKWEPRHTIKPTQQITIVRAVDNDRREAISARWGLVPYWTMSIKTSFGMVSAKAEEVAEVKSYAEPFRTQRCVFLMDGYYEPHERRKDKRNFFVHFKDNRVFCVAGVWYYHQKLDVLSCSLMTTPANPVLSEFYSRMPAIVDGANLDAWLDPRNNQTDQLVALLTPYFDSEMVASPIG